MPFLGGSGIVFSGDMMSELHPYLYTGDAPFVEWSKLSTAVTLHVHGSIPERTTFMLPEKVALNDLIGVPPAALDCKDAAVLKVEKLDRLDIIVRVTEVRDCHGCSLGHDHSHICATLGANWKLWRSRLRLIDHADPDGLWQASIAVPCPSVFRYDLQE